MRAAALYCAPVLLLLCSTAARPSEAPRDPPWIADERGVLELLLAHDETGGPDVGVLRFDANERRVAWEGIGPQGCPRRIEAAFEDVRTARTRREGGFVLELRGAREQKLAFIPLPHAPWLTPQYTVKPGRLDSFLESSDVLSGRGPSRASGTGSTAPTLAARDLPAAVVADTQMAVDRLLEALGRAPAPVALLREALYGRPVDLSPAEVREESDRYAGRAVRLRGRSEVASPGAGYRLVEEGSAVRIEPEREIAALVQLEAPRWEGHEVEVTGVLKRRAESPAGGGGADAGAGYVVSFWAFAGPESAVEGIQEGEPTTLEALCAAGGALDGRRVHVIGKFRGRNLYGDLQSRSRPRPGAWVIKDDRYAVWVTGKEPAGAGWALDVDSLEATSNWLELVARPRTHGGVVSLQASRIAVIPPPAAARVLPPQLTLVGGDAPPAIMFTLPLEGEPVSQGSRLAIQFTQYMQDESFRGRVRLRYAGPVSAEAAAIRIRTTYDETHRALIVEPEQPLDPGRELELLLLPGILDARGVPLAPRPGGGVVGAAGAVDVVRYVAGS
jgi:hypothetical protein